MSGGVTGKAGDSLPMSIRPPVVVLEPASAHRAKPDNKPLSLMKSPERRPWAFKREDCPAAFAGALQIRPWSSRRRDTAPMPLMGIRLFLGQLH